MCVCIYLKRTTLNLRYTYTHTHTCNGETVYKSFRHTLFSVKSRNNDNAKFLYNLSFYDELMIQKKIKNGLIGDN